MSDKNTAVFGIYPTQESADAAVDTLRTRGFRPTDMSVLFPENSGSKEFGHEKGTKSAEGAVAGGGTGAVIGGALGWLAGIGMLAIPGVGPFIAAGPIVAALAGMGAGGAIGGTTGALIGLGIPEYQAKRYEGRMRKGGILLSVHADNHEWTSKGRQISRTDGRGRHRLDGRDQRRLRQFGPPNRPSRTSTVGRQSKSSSSRKAGGTCACVWIVDNGQRRSTSSCRASSRRRPFCSRRTNAHHPARCRCADAARSDPSLATQRGWGYYPPSPTRSDAL